MKRRRRLRNIDKKGVRSRGSLHPIINLYTFLIGIITSLIVGAEVIVLTILSPQRFEQKSSEVELSMHAVVKDVDLSRPVPPNNTKTCDNIVNRKVSESETLIWESIACTRPINSVYDSIREEEARALRADDKFRFDAFIVKEEAYMKVTKARNVADLMIWMRVNTTSPMYTFTHSVRILPFGGKSTAIFQRANSKLVAKMLAFSIKRKFGGLCVVNKAQNQPKGILLIKVACERGIGALDNVWFEYLRSGKELFTQTKLQELFSVEERSGVPIKGCKFDPVVKVVHGVNLTSWRLILPFALILLAILSTAVRSVATRQVSAEATNDLFRRACLNECDLLPFSGPPLKTRQVLIDTAETYHLQLDIIDRKDAEILQNKDLRGTC